MSITLVTRAASFHARLAIVDADGTYGYDELLNASAAVASALLRETEDLGEKRVTFLVPPGFHYIATLWGIWRAGGVAVPLAMSHPQAELAYVLDDSDPVVVVSHASCEARLREVVVSRRLPLLLTSDMLESPRSPLPDVDETRRALMLYTSGTTGKPKGVVTTHAQIQAQITSLVDAWEWTQDDRILLVLPLHHVHGIVNVLLCALWSAACCEMLTRFDAEETWARLASSLLTLFMAVPTIYRRLIVAWEQAPTADQEKMSEACGRLRLMVSGSAALPVSVLERWIELSGHVLLERYGMTEIGMGLSNSLLGERFPGSVGTPLPRVEVRVVDEEMRDVSPGTPGELLINGPNVFREYWRRPKETAESFYDGFFKTGDVVVVEDERYRIMGRRSVDIIKTGGYKVSALEIEEVLRTHPTIQECAVVGAPDVEWGEKVCVAVELVAGSNLELADLKTWARDLLAPYKVPKELRIVDGLPRNAMGKVTKPVVVELFNSKAGTS
jgi:malonyl-CoA/methylmalonyl-CoA synthetase